eukprot:TRINITY_DN6842_c0_g2_i1.p1 TRINITY_DN6842_c0_g2~~TRINITY_DN6842_c0_g2_i1.p1  ORF type:complete len:577 (-),score=184.32 TRINITY_DN6842_c0_g2_i1:393-2123(-)
MDGQWQTVNTQAKKQEKFLKWKAEKEKEDKEKGKSSKEEKKENDARFKKEQELLQQEFKARKAAGVPDIDNAFFSAFTEEQERRRRKDEQRKQQNRTASQKQKPKAAVVQKPTYSEVGAQLDTAALSGAITQYSNKYAGNYDVQLKCLADYLELLFNDAEKEEVPDKSYLDKLQFPLAYLSQEAVVVLVKWLERIPEDQLAAFFWFLVSTLVTVSVGKSQQKVGGEASKSSMVGLKLLVQLLVRIRPSVLSKNLPRIRSTYAPPAKQSSAYSLLDAKSLGLEPQYVPTLVWVFSQAYRQPALSLLAFLHLVFPAISEPTAQPHVRDSALSFLEFMLSRGADVPVEDSVAVSTVEKVLFCQADPKVNPRLKAILKPLLSIAFDEAAVSRRMFQMLLHHAASPREDIRDEALSRIFLAFSHDASVYEAWAELYPHHIAHSNNVLLYLDHHWENHDLANAVDAAKFLELLKVFKKVNEQLLTGTYTEAKSKKVRKATASEVVEISKFTVTCGVVKDKLRDSASVQARRSSGSSAVTQVLVLVAGSLFGGAVYFWLHCCQTDVCRNSPLAKYIVGPAGCP